MPRIRTYNDLAEPDRSDLLGQVTAQRSRVAARLAPVRHVVAVASGKGGVGKSFVTAGLAAALARSSRAIGVLDADLQSPTAARMLGVPVGRLEVTGDAVIPPRSADGIRVMSSELLLAEGAPLQWKEPAHERFVWRGTLETGMLREFLSDVEWGTLDVLLVDLPPGGDRLGALTELVPNLAGIVVVTIPSDASLRAVRRGVREARDRGVRVLGIVENMAGYACGKCGEVSPLFSGDAAQQLAKDADAPILASIPFDPATQKAWDGGTGARGHGTAAPQSSQLPAHSPAAALERAATALMSRLP